MYKWCGFFFKPNDLLLVFKQDVQIAKVTPTIILPPFSFGTSFNHLPFSLGCYIYSWFLLFCGYISLSACSSVLCTWCCHRPWILTVFEFNWTALLFKIASVRLQLWGKSHYCFWFPHIAYLVMHSPSADSEQQLLC